MLAYERARRPGRALDDAQRAVVLGDARLRLRGARPRPHATSATRMAAVHHLLLGHGLAARQHARGRPAATRSNSASPSTSAPPPRRPTARRTARPAAAPTALGTRLYLDPIVHGRYPRGHRRRPRAAQGVELPVQDGDLADHRHPARRPRRQLLPRRPLLRRHRGRLADRRRRPARHPRRASATCRAPPWTGRSPPTELTDLLLRLAARLRAADRHHRERRRLRRHRRRRTAPSTTPTAPPTSPTTSPPSPQARAGAPTSAATSPGR